MVVGTRRDGLRALALLLPALGPVGCTEYLIETTVNPDGSGLRVERIQVEGNDGVEASPAQYPLLMHTGPREGWSHRVEVEERGDTVHVFDRRWPVEDLDAWSRLTGSVQIDGATPDKAGDRLGYVTLGNIRFRNHVQVGLGEVGDGSRSYTYRESFAWEDALDAVVEYFMTDVDRALSARYPRLSEGERGGIVGFARARYWVAVEEGLLDDDKKEEELIAEVVRRTAERGVRVVRVRYPEAGEEDLRELLRGVLLDEDEERLLTLVRELPGLELALNAEFVVRLDLPGQVTSTNAHKREGTTLVWEFGPGDALRAPVEIHAESVARQ